MYAQVDSLVGMKDIRISDGMVIEMISNRCVVVSKQGHDVGKELGDGWHEVIPRQVDKDGMIVSAWLRD